MTFSARDTLLQGGITQAMSQLANLIQVSTHVSSPSTTSAMTLATPKSTTSPAAQKFLAETLRALAISSWRKMGAITSLQCHSHTFRPSVEDIFHDVEITNLCSDSSHKNVQQITG